MRTKTVKVTHIQIGDHEVWRVEDEKGEHNDDNLEPDIFVRAAMGGRSVGYFRAVWSVDEGWQFRRFMVDLPNVHRF